MGRKVSIGNMVGMICRSSAPEVFLGKGVLKTYSKFRAEHPCGVPLHFY